MDEYPYSDEELRAFAVESRDQHTPEKQGHSYQRCARCGYTRHPCDVYDLADAVVRLLDRLESR